MGMEASYYLGPFATYELPKEEDGIPLHEFMEEICEDFRGVSECEDLDTKAITPDEKPTFQCWHIYPFEQDEIIEIPPREEIDRAIEAFKQQYAEQFQKMEEAGISLSFKYGIVPHIG